MRIVQDADMITRALVIGKHAAPCQSLTGCLNAQLACVLLQRLDQIDRKEDDNLAQLFNLWKQSPIKYFQVVG